MRNGVSKKPEQSGISNRSTDVFCMLRWDRIFASCCGVSSFVRKDRRCRDRAAFASCPFDGRGLPNFKYRSFFEDGSFSNEPQISFL